MPNELLATVLIHATQEDEWLPAEDLRSRLAEAVGGRGPVAVDVSGVDHLDTRPLQLLLALAGERQALQLPVKLLHVSAGLARWFRHVGADSLLELMETQPEN